MRGALLGIVLLAACGEGPASSPAGARAERALYADALWDDGNAEVAQYRVRARRYGTLRDGVATLIVVKETFDAEDLVKADLGTDQPLEVMKLNHVLTVPTGVYTYRQMASVFLTRERALPVKLVTSSQEWCGVTHKRMVVRGRTPTLHTSSYFGEEGERAYPLAMDERTVLFDALPMWVRTLDLTQPGPRAVLLVSEQLSNQAPPPVIGPARVTVGAARAVTVPAGTFDAVPVTVAHDGGTEVFHLDVAAPHTIVRWERADGGEYALEWVRRAPYWRMHDLGDEDALPGPTPGAPESDSASDSESAAAPPPDPHPVGGGAERASDSESDPDSESESESESAAAPPPDPLPVGGGAERASARVAPADSDAP